MSPLTSFSSPRALPRRRKTSSCRPCRASREAATTSARICRRPTHAGEGGGARQSARTLGGTGARPLESMAHRTQLSAERPQRSGAPNGCAPCQWRADAQARERRCPSFSMELAMSSVWVPCWSASRLDPGQLERCTLEEGAFGPLSCGIDFLWALRLRHKSTKGLRKIRRVLFQHSRHLHVHAECPALT